MRLSKKKQSNCMISDIGWWDHQLRHIEDWKTWMTLRDILKPGTIEFNDRPKGVTGGKENGRCITKLENMGFRVGQGLIERFTKDTARFKDELDIMKFICKDFWTTVFKKQIDNLRTNHQGIYVLQDNKFRLLTQMSAGKQYLEHASKYLAFTCGLIRGGLSNLGIKSIVTAEVSSMPAFF
ncbi:trafficking protein particle complex subunit 6B isoform X2 [Panthera tigris]|uniref:trafficking protein particle complex subunit 6B isoform X2 n=1 Tax=Panthera tigris TaxID=9694 RepID=UPI001C6F7701|nr:trafficking protein particle complex subunit 6B isoform X2 [Panthera tigris]